MIFAGIPSGTSVFIDANTFVYHFMPHPVLQPACSALLARVAQRDVLAVASTHVLNDVAHRIMATDAVAKLAWPVAGIVQRLRTHPHEIRNGGNRFQGVESSSPHDLTVRIVSAIRSSLSTS